MLFSKGIFNLRKHSALRSVGLYTFSNFLTKSVSFLLVFIFTDPKYITPSENGMLSLFNNALIFLKPVMMMGIIHSVSVDFFKMEKDRFRDSFTTGFFLSALVGFFSVALFLAFRGYLNLQYGFSTLIIFLIPLLTFFIFCFDQLQNILRSEQRPEMFMKVGVSKLVIELGLSVLLVVAFNWRWYGRVAGMLTSHMVLAVFGVIYFVRRGYLFGAVRKEFVRSELAYALPVIALQMAFFAVNSSDKFFLSHFTDDNNKTVGIYSIASVFASVVFTLHHALIQYVFPRIFETLASGKPDFAAIRRHFIYYSAAMGAAALLLIAGTPVIYHFFINPLYLPALDYLYLFCIGYFLWSVSYFFFAFILFHKNKVKILVLSLSGILISLSLNYYGISRWGAWGGAASVALSCLAILILTLMMNAREVKLVFFSSHGNR